MFYLLTVLLLWRRQPHERYTERETEGEGKKLSRGKCGKLLCLEMENFTTVQRMRCAYQLSHLASKRKRALERQGEERERERERGDWQLQSLSRASERTWKVCRSIYLFIYLAFLLCRQFTFLFIMRETGENLGGKLKLLLQSEAKKNCKREGDRERGLESEQ